MAQHYPLRSLYQSILDVLQVANRSPCYRGVPSRRQRTLLVVTPAFRGLGNRRVLCRFGGPSRATPKIRDVLTTKLTALCLPDELAFPCLTARRKRLAQLEATVADHEADPTEREYWRQAATESWRRASLLRLRKAPRPQTRTRLRGRTSRRRRRRVTSGQRRARAPGPLGDDPDPPPEPPLDLFDAVAFSIGWERVA